MPARRKFNPESIRELYEETTLTDREICERLGMNRRQYYRYVYCAKYRCVPITKWRKKVRPKVEGMTMTERQHRKQVSMKKAWITRKRNEAKRMTLLTDKIEAYRIIKDMEKELLEFRMNYFSLVA